MDRSMTMPSRSYVSNGVDPQPMFKTAWSLGGGAASAHRKKVSWVPDTVDNEDVVKKCFKKETYVPSSMFVSTSDWDCAADVEGSEIQTL